MAEWVPEGRDSPWSWRYVCVWGGGGMEKEEHLCRRLALTQTVRPTWPPILPTPSRASVYPPGAK